MCFCFESVVPVGREAVFAFFANPGHLTLLHAGCSSVRLLHHENQVRVGAQTWVEVTSLGFVPMVLGFRHMVYESPACFGELAIHGPFSRFLHVHQFEDCGGQTVIRDLLEVTWPWRYGGAALLRKVVAPRINRMFRLRSEALQRLVEDGALSSQPDPSQPAGGG